MPYAEATTIAVHMPSRSYPYYVFVSETTEIERRYNDLFGEREVTYSILNTVKAGIYGFTNLDNRNSFVSLLNRSSENEVAFIAAMVKQDSPTSPVE